MLYHLTDPREVTGDLEIRYAKDVQAHGFQHFSAIVVSRNSFVCVVSATIDFDD